MMRFVSRLLVVGIAFGASAAWGEEPHWQEHPHHLALVVAGTTDEEETAFTLGVDYEYRLAQLVGLGAVVEYAFEDIDALTLIGVADVHVWRGFAIQTGPGVEFIDGESPEFVYRIGGLYEFEFEGFTLSPQVHYDATTGEDAVVYGISFGFGF
jgi:hypothetical protein